MGDVVIASLMRALQERYGLDRAAFLRRLSGGYANDIFLVKVANVRVVVRVEYPPIDLDSLAWEHRLLRLLSNHMPEVARPFRTLDGDTFFLFDGRPVSLFPYISGSPARAPDRVAVARALARLHATDIKVPERPGHSRLRDLPFPEIGHVPPSLEQWQPLIGSGRKDAIALVRRIDHTRALRTGVTHNDLFPGNVLVDHGQVSGILDWEEADIDWLIWDFACTLWCFCNRSDEELDADAAATFITAYRDAGGIVPPEEEDLIVPLIRVKRILEVLRAPTDRDPLWDYQLANLRAYESLQ